MTLNVNDLRDYVVGPTLRAANLWSPAAEILMLGTALHESTVASTTRLHQIKGPAIGIYQMEPLTHFDLWLSFLKYQPILRETVLDMIPKCSLKFDSATGIMYGADALLATDLRYATVMARIKYRQVKEAMPAENDFVGLAQYWKKYYNSALGKGTVEEFTRHYVQYVGALPSPGTLQT
jgi:hypothetical protein